MRMNERIALSLSGIALTGGFALVGGAADAATHDNTGRAAQIRQLDAADSDALARCRFVRGRYRRTHGRRVWIPGHWSPRGCHRRHRRF